jgi:hypothetical protein
VTCATWSAAEGLLPADNAQPHWELSAGWQCPSKAWQQALSQITGDFIKRARQSKNDKLIICEKAPPELFDGLPTIKYTTCKRS